MIALSIRIICLARIVSVLIQMGPEIGRYVLERRLG